MVLGHRFALSKPFASYRFGSDVALIDDMPLKISSHY